MLEKKHETSEVLLHKLRELSNIVTNWDHSIDYKYQKSLELVRNVLNFDMSILYQVKNTVDDLLLLQVVKTYDPENLRRDLYPGKNLVIKMLKPEPEYINEVNAFKTEAISTINVPGVGSDMVGYIYLPNDIGGSLLFGGDYIGERADTSQSEKDTFLIMCNLISSLLIRSHYRELATHDGLTGLYNSRFIREELEKAFKRHSRDKHIKICAVLCDIDFFKKVNDNYGHIQGDIILKEVADILHENTRMGFDTVGRYGGEEFLVIMEGVDQHQAKEIVDRWRENIETHNFSKTDEEGTPTKDGFLKITMSFGIAHINSEVETHVELLNNADKALYEAKESGRNKVKISTK